MLLVVLFVTGIVAEHPCPTSNINNLYRELNCEPVYENASLCPSSYNCLKFEARNRDHCNYRGRSYAVGEQIPEEVSDPCFKHCVCVKDGDEPSFSCAVVECPENWSHPPSENCVLLYSKNKCCSIDTYCPNETSTRNFCVYDGKTYYEGQKFYPKGDSCKRCYCKPGFNGILEEPFCESINCNVELIRGNRLNENCVPVYYGKNGCCPISWKCHISDLGPLDRSLHELGMLSAITDSRYQYMDEMRRKRSCTMDSRTKRCAFHILQINSNFVGNISPCKLCTKRSNYRVKPYFTPINKYIPFQSESISERTRTKSENSDTGNENVDVKDSESVMLSAGLYKSKSLENINTSSHSSSREFKMELDELKKRTEENTDVELVSSKIKCLNVSNK